MTQPDDAINRAVERFARITQGDVLLEKDLERPGFVADLRFLLNDYRLLKDRAVGYADLVATLNYVADMTYCGADAEWHFKPGYDPQCVLDALAKADELSSHTLRR